MYQSIPKPPMPPPSSPWAFEVFDEITQCVGSLDGQMPTGQHIKKHQIPHPPATVPKFPNASNRLFKYKHCYTHPKYRAVSKSCLMEVCSFTIKLFIPESPHLQAFSKVLKAPTNQRIQEQRAVNTMLILNAVRITKSFHLRR